MCQDSQGPRKQEAFDEEKRALLDYLRRNPRDNKKITLKRKTVGEVPSFSRTLG